MNEAQCRQIVAQRSAGRCEGAIPGVCTGLAQNMHHRRKPGRVWAPSNVLHLCGSGTTGCHGWIEHHPELAYQHGLSVRAHDDPATESVHMRWECLYAWWFLDDEGMLTEDPSDEPYEPVRLSSAAPSELLSLYRRHVALP